MTMPSDDPVTEVYPVRRLEVFTGAGRRRTWTADAKAQIVAQTWEAGESVCSVARRYGLAPTQVFAWRRDARRRTSAAAEPMFAAVIVEPPVEGPTARSRSKPQRRKNRRGGDGGIELEIGGVTVRVGRGAEAKTVAAIIQALKADR